MTTSTMELTTIRFCGVNFTLETLRNYEFIQLYDSIVDHASDLIERSTNMPLHVYHQHKAAHDKALADTAANLLLLDKEADRRAALPAGPGLCLMCEGLHDPVDLCDDCQEAYNNFESARFVEVAA